MTISRNKGISRIHTACLFLIILILGCKTRDKTSYDEFYWKFHHTFQKVDTVSEKIEFLVSDKKVNKREIDTLCSILTQWGWEYHVSTDSALFIRRYGNDIINTMRGLDDELYHRMKDTVNRLIH
jgi:hypothetical protein